MSRSKITLFFILLLFGGPFILAYVVFGLYQGSSVSTTNYGELVSSNLHISDLKLVSLEHNVLEKDAMQGHWWIVIFAPKNCDKSCQDMLYYAKQSHVALGKEASRIKKLIVLPDDKSTDTLKFVQTKDFYEVVALDKEQQANALYEKIKDEQHPVYLIDPMGNVVMRYETSFIAAKFLKDIKHLLKHSKIG